MKRLPRLTDEALYYLGATTLILFTIWLILEVAGLADNIISFIQ